MAKDTRMTSDSSERRLSEISLEISTEARPMGRVRNRSITPVWKSEFRPVPTAIARLIPICPSIPGTMYWM